METEVPLFLLGAVLFRFLGDARFVGDSGARGSVSSGSNICDGSMLSPVFARLVRATVRGVGGTPVVVLLFVRRGLRCGAGVNSSASSSGGSSCITVSSPSDSSTTIFFLLAALREGRVGDIEAIVYCRLCELMLRIASGET